jgi:hypothetical protein
MVLVCHLEPSLYLTLVLCCRLYIFSLPKGDGDKSQAHVDKMLRTRTQILKLDHVIPGFTVADPDPGSGVFFTSGSGIWDG